jgi:hypothetical protein
MHPSLARAASDGFGTGVRDEWTPSERARVTSGRLRNGRAGSDASVVGASAEQYNQTRKFYKLSCVFSI